MSRLLLQISSIATGMCVVCATPALSDSVSRKSLGDLFTEICFGSAPTFEQGAQIGENLGMVEAETGVLQFSDHRATFLVGPASLFLRPDTIAVGEGFDLVEVEQSDCTCSMFALDSQPEAVVADIYGIARDDWSSKFTDWWIMDGLGKIKMEFEQEIVEIAFEQRNVAGIGYTLAYAISSSECSA